jgi:hypothetical protein
VSGATAGLIAAVSGATATLVVGGVVVAAGAVGWLVKRYYASKEKALEAANRWKEIAGRLTAGLDQVAWRPDEGTLQDVKREFRELQGAKADVADAFKRNPEVVDTERKLRFLLSHGVQEADTAVNGDNPKKVQAAQLEIREVTAQMVDDPIRHVFEPQVSAALKKPRKGVADPISEKAQRERLDQYVNDHGGLPTMF